ncbi:hypothetical protein LK09_02740 [Microbacterium mangrovi]|uniref:Uncharacterized protein n=1 Tax=Microbacterium mangrovi TaxID=1348253 RepID=A0A0B2ADA8_9MICO|nr:hypothetical protein LK09_02740 [Microbacterium mangrovi]
MLAAGLAVGLAGCGSAAPTPSPTPTPPFASADAAYRAAEATYRGYVDAGNQVDLDDPKTFEPVYAWLLGDALDTDEEELTAMSAKRWKLSGKYRIDLLQPLPSDTSDPLWGDVFLVGCFNVSDIELSDSEGMSVVSPSRRDHLPVKISFSRDASTPTGMKIIKIEDRKGEPACAPS